jgi:ribosomal protein S18 acetylase RimI-like enzyme
VSRSLESVADYGIETLVGLFRRCFEGYLVDLQMTAEMLGEFIRVDHIDLLASRVVRENGEDAALALVSRRGARARVAAMGVTAPHRRRGVGRWLMEQLIAQSEERGERSLQLEVVEQNVPARALYESVGFVVRRRLVGFRGESIIGSRDADLEWIEPQDVAGAMIADGIEDPGWVLSPQSILGLSLPSRGVRLGPALAVISNPETPVIGLQSLYVPSAQRRNGHATRLVRALGARFPRRLWRVRVVVPEGLCDAFLLANGFVCEELTQQEMIHERPAPDSPGRSLGPAPGLG